MLRQFDKLICENLNIDLHMIAYEERWFIDPGYIREKSCSVALWNEKGSGCTRGKQRHGLDEEKELIGWQRKSD